MSEPTKVFIEEELYSSRPFYNSKMLLKPVQYIQVIFVLNITNNKCESQNLLNHVFLDGNYMSILNVPFQISVK